ncbi:MAG: hypothetical protein IT438_04830 [Phycisphaerales bacterium]|nr:hypothetical protein [Phycisphaerales bacterium]
MIDPREQLDLLISRIADGEAGEQDWAAFSALAEADPTGAAWKHLAQAQRDHAAMSLAVGVALHAADRVDLPSQEAAALFTHRRHAPRRLRTFSRLGAFGGWAAAAAVALAWFGGFGSGNGPFRGGGETNTANLLPANWTSDDAARAYLDIGAKQGRVIGELPNRVPVYTQPTTLESGQPGVRVFYVRQFVESAIVTDVARLGLDESGRPVPVPAAMPMPVSWPAQ